MIKSKSFRFLILGLLLTVACPLAGYAQGTSKSHPTYNMLGRDAKEITSPTSPLNPNFVMGEGAKKMDPGRFWNSQHISERLIGLSVADLNQDGRQEVVYATLKSVYVSQVEGRSLKTLASHRFETTERVLSVDTYDVDGDGQKEIIVSAQRNDYTPASYVFKYNSGSNQLTKLAVNTSWYLRVVGMPSGPELMGQKNSSKRRQAFDGRVHRLSFSGNNFKSQGEVRLPRGVDLYSFSQGPLGSSQEMVTACTKWPDEHLWLYSISGKEKLWETNEEYAGTVNHIKAKMDSGDSSYVYLPSRILFADVDRDGQKELIVAKNDRSGIAFMSRLRSFNGGAVVVFKYENLSLMEYFRTPPLSGAAVDYQFADFDNNGTEDLVIGVVVEEGGGLFEDARSLIVAYELGHSKSEPQSQPATKGRRSK